jgi:membrane protein DedA with SNARE-associated domain
MHDLKTIISTLLSLVVQGSPWALGIILLLGAITEVGIPTLFAIDAVVLFASFQVGLFSVGLLLVVLALLLGRLLGSSIIYWFSKSLGKRFLNWLEKYQPRICAQINSVSNRLNNRAAFSIALARLTPGLLTASSIGSGLVRIKFNNFVLGVALSSLIADLSLVFIGALAKTGFSAFGIKPEPWQVGIGAFAFLIIGWGTYFIIRNLRAKKAISKVDDSCPLPK